MSQTWIVTNKIQNGSPAHKETRFSGSLFVMSLCESFDISNYQPKAVGLDRLGRKI